MSQAQGRTGIPSFVSLLEPRAIVLADHAIVEKLSAEIWQEPVDLLIQGVKCGELFSPHFPVAEDAINELRNHLVVKE